ncbi:hypothetical protein [Microscilla marina]|uniref:hypothetical protein n=1 Tax=Microscilla marina TaxID=1027 RepID=UPI0005D4826B|nr:hypothetical protein [Microscilla marina]
MRKTILLIAIFLSCLNLDKAQAQKKDHKEILAYKFKGKNIYDIAGVYYFDYSVILFPDSTYLAKSLLYLTRAEKKQNSKKPQIYNGNWKYSVDSSLVTLFEGDSVFAKFIIKKKKSVSSASRV